MTIASIFLCGIVVTYVANADNYRQKFESTSQNYRSEQQKRANAEQQLAKTTEQLNRLEKELNDKIAALNIKIEQLQSDLGKAEGEKSQLLQRVDGFAAEVTTFTKTNQDQRVLLEDTIRTWKDVEAELITEQSQHKETARLLLEKMAIIKTLEETNKRRQEENVELQAKLDQLLRQYGKVLAPSVPVTPITEKVRPALPPSKEISLRGQIIAVDVANKMAELSIGKAHGVEEGMRFHVIRGSQFICDIVISDVEPEKAVGWLELMQAEPRAGDNASTNL
jgi:seryl-tRNA synthetase